jgi:hypothetical protein
MQQTDHLRNRVRQPYSGEETDSPQAKRQTAQLRQIETESSAKAKNQTAQLRHRGSQFDSGWTTHLRRRVIQLHQASRLPTQLRYKCRQISPSVESDNFTRSRDSKLNLGVDTDSSTQA